MTLFNFNYKVRLFMWFGVIIFVCRISILRFLT